MKKYFLLLMLMLPMLSKAQEGRYLHVVGGAQWVRFSNTDDIYSSVFRQSQDIFKLEDTYRPTFGLEYINNWDSTWGFQTGVLFAGQGQRYSGYVTDDVNSRFPGDTLTSGPTSYTSHIHLEYLKIPIALRINSSLDGGDRVSLAIFAGLQVGVLLSVSDVQTNPAPPAHLVIANPEYYKRFSTFDFSWVAGGQFSFQLNRRWGLSLNARYDRSFTDAENKDYLTKYSTSDFQRMTENQAAEYLYPVSTKKSTPLPARDDYFTRSSTRNSTIAGYIGVYFRL